MEKKIGVLVGSLRKDSYNRKMAQALIALAPKTLKLEIIEIKDLGLYNQDLDETPPAEWLAFREKVKACDGLIFASPEYNRSISGVLKNAIDIGSRPYGKSVWEGKPGAVITVSPSAIGGFGANQHLRQTFVFLNIPCMQQPEAYVGNAGNLFDEKGHFKDESTQKFISNFIHSYEKWVDTFLK